MRVIVDTCVWSLALRRCAVEPGPEVTALRDLVRERRVEILGPIRQELLSGIRDEQRFERLRTHLAAFPDIPLEPSDYVEAARCSNRCRSAGIQGSATDFVICAAALRRDLAIFTTDADFDHYARVLGVALHRVIG
ncbi:MAG: PIN domain-containing protein [Armatimonadetes bacterium]|nr:PIN domain-containing protein [Armatimonadota bacterium]